MPHVQTFAVHEGGKKPDVAARMRATRGANELRERLRDLKVLTDEEIERWVHEQYPDAV